MRKLFACLFGLAFTAAATAAGPTATTLSGTVVDGTGQPISGAEIRALSSLRGKDTPPEVSTRSGADGRFQLDGLVLGKSYTITATRQGLAPFSAPLEAAAPGSAPLKIVLQRGSTAAGRVVDLAGNPVAGAELTLHKAAHAWEAMGGQLLPVTVSDATGRFRFSDLGPGQIHFVVQRGGFVSRFVQGIEIPAEPRTVDVGEIILELGVALEGRATDQHGAPVSGARASLGCVPQTPAGFQPSITDAAGRFRIEDLPRGALCDLYVQKTGFVPVEIANVQIPTRELVQVELPPDLAPDHESVNASLDVQPGVNDLDLVLPGAFAVDGRVLDPSGNPAPGVAVSFQAPGVKDFRTTTFADGSFRFPGVPEGDYVLGGEKDGLVGMMEPGEIHIAGQARHGLELRLQRGALLTGQLVGFTPEELREVRVFAFREPGSGDLSHRMGVVREGIYRVLGLCPGRWRVLATAGDRTAQGIAVIDAGVPQATLDVEMTTGDADHP